MAALFHPCEPEGLVRSIDTSPSLAYTFLRPSCSLRASWIPPMTPQQFIAKCKRADLSERSACQQHFLDLCELLGHPKPAEVDPNGTWFTFKKGADKVVGGGGWADAWWKGEQIGLMQ